MKAAILPILVLAFLLVGCGEDGDTGRSQPAGGGSPP